MRSVSPLGSPRGFTLPEVLVSLAVFGIAGAALFSTLALNVRSNSLAKEISEATSAAQSAIEYLRTQPITAAMTSCPSLPGGMVPSLYTATCALGTAGSPVSGTRELTLALSWSNAGTRNVTLLTYVTY